MYKLTTDRSLHSKWAHDDQHVVVFSFLKNYRNLSSILILLTHSSYLLFVSRIMSEFAGPISEFLGVSIDRFNGENLKSKVYFLSHCHTDHMVGLNELELFERLKHYNLKNYCHKVLVALLSALPLYFYLTPFIIPLDSDNETTLNVSLEGDETHTLTVTPIPAGHCAGSVMFLLVSKEKPVLFTGDFRWQVVHTKRINHLFDNLKEAAVQNFDNIYVNTPFCKTDSNFIPCRKSCLSAIVQACPHGYYHFKKMWSIFVTKLATVFSF